jgi:hypothetical protein
VIELPSVAIPAAVKRAAEQVETRQSDVQEAHAALQAAEADVSEAERRDQAAFAEAVNAGKPDPGPKHVEQARRLVEDRTRAAEGHKLRLEQAEAHLDGAITAALADWEAATRKAVEAAEAKVMKALAVVGAAENERAHARVGLLWLYRRRAGQPKLPRLDFIAATRSTLPRNQNDPECYTVGELLDFVREGVRRVTLAGEAEQAEARARREAQDDANREKIRQGRALFSGTG